MQKEYTILVVGASAELYLNSKITCAQLALINRILDESVEQGLVLLCSAVDEWAAVPGRRRDIRVDENGRGITISLWTGHISNLFQWVPTRYLTKAGMPQLRMVLRGLP